MTTPTPDQNAPAVNVTTVPIDPQQRYLLVFQTPTRISAEKQRQIAAKVRQWWNSDEPFLLVNLLPDEHVRLEWIKT